MVKKCVVLMWWPTTVSPTKQKLQTKKVTKKILKKAFPNFFMLFSLFEFFYTQNITKCHGQNGMYKKLNETK